MISFISAGSGDIINGNVKLILGLIWTLILHYQISIGFGIKDGDRDGKGGKTGKQALLEWLQVRGEGSPFIFEPLGANDSPVCTVS